MGYKCKDCGNDEEFEAGACDYIRIIVDANGDYLKTIESVGNMEIFEEVLTCCKCQSENVAWFEPKQVELGAVAGGE